MVLGGEECLVEFYFWLLIKVGGIVISCCFFLIKKIIRGYLICSGCNYFDFVKYCCYFEVVIGFVNYRYKEYL